MEPGPMVSPNHTPDEDLDAALVLVRVLIRALSPYRNSILIQLEIRIERALAALRATDERAQA